MHDVGPQPAEQPPEPRQRERAVAGRLAQAMHLDVGAPDAGAAARRAVTRSGLPPYRWMWQPGRAAAAAVSAAHLNAKVSGLGQGFDLYVDHDGDEAKRRCRMVSAKPTVPARLSFSSASARLNSSRTYSVTFA